MQNVFDYICAQFATKQDTDTLEQLLNQYQQEILQELNCQKLSAESQLLLLEQFGALVRSNDCQTKTDVLVCVYRHCHQKWLELNYDLWEGLTTISSFAKELENLKQLLWEDLCAREFIDLDHFNRLDAIYESAASSMVDLDYLSKNKQQISTDLEIIRAALVAAIAK